VEQDLGVGLLLADVAVQLADLALGSGQFVVSQLLDVVEVVEGSGCGVAYFLQLSGDVGRVGDQGRSETENQLLVLVKFDVVSDHLVGMVYSCLHYLYVSAEPAEKESFKLLSHLFDLDMEMGEVVIFPFLFRPWKTSRSKQLHNGVFIVIDFCLHRFFNVFDDRGLDGLHSHCRYHLPGLGHLPYHIKLLLPDPRLLDKGRFGLASAGGEVGGEFAAVCEEDSR
jgi:hypothetical protein